VEIAVKPRLNEQDVDFFAQGINKLGNVRFEAFTAVTMKNAFFWDVAPCRYCVN
jgi:hypothetical protein